MSKSKGLLSTTIVRKMAMALSALFLMVFLLQHLTINLLSIFSEDAFNSVSHFMGTNPLVQFVLQPVLFFGVIFHFVMGFILEIKNKGARSVKYANYNGGANASWMSRNMIWTGAAILGFLLLHLYDFWLHEMVVKYVNGDTTGLIDPTNPESGFRYYEELGHTMSNAIRVVIYIVAFVFLGLHLNHGFASAFQSIGASRVRGIAEKVGKIYSIAVPAGFILVAIYQFVQNLNH